MAMVFLWKPEKNELLKDERSICFEDVLHALIQGGFRDVLEYKGTKQIHKGHLILVVQIRGQIWRVPFTLNRGLIFLRTIYPAPKTEMKHES